MALLDTENDDEEVLTLFVYKVSGQMAHTAEAYPGFYLNNRVFLSRNYRLIVAPQKFDVLKTNICPRSEA